MNLKIAALLWSAAAFSPHVFAHVRGMAMPDLPLRFEANRGQTDARVRFLARTGGASVFLTSTEAVLSAPNLVLRTHPSGSNPNPQITGEDKHTGSIRYYRDGFLTATEAYDRVRYHDVYPGIDLIYYGTGSRLEYDFRIAPGADPNRIRLSFEGARGVSITPEGDLLLDTAGGRIREHAPVIFQDQHGQRERVRGGYVMTGAHQVSFRVGAYDKHRELVIDPVILYSTYIEGSNNDLANDMKVDANGYVYLTGSTTSPNFPTVPGGAFQGNKDIFVTKLSPDGHTIVYSTFLGQGESGGDAGSAIFVDSSGNAYITGFISHLLLLGDAQYAVVAKLNSDGSLAFFNRVTSTTGTADEYTYDITVDSAKNIYIAGWTDTDTIPIVNGFQNSPNSFGSGFVIMLDSNAQNILYSTYIGSSGFSRAHGVAVDTGGCMYVTGQTSQIPITPGAFQSAPAGGDDAYVMKIDPRGNGTTAIIYSTYIGGGELDTGNNIKVDAHGVAWITGETKSNYASSVPIEFPVTPNAAQKHLGYTLAATAYCNGSGQVDFCPDAFVTGVSADGHALVYSSYLGGDGPDVGQGLALDPVNGRVYITGQACGFFPVTGDATQSKAGSCATGFLAVFDPAQTSTLVFSTFLGGSGTDQGTAVARDPGGNIWVAGQTTSTDFPLAGNPLFSTGGGSRTSVFVTQFSLGGSGSQTVPITLASSPAGASAAVTGAGCSPGSYRLPATLQWTASSVCGVTITAPAAPAGTQFGAVSWADGAAGASRTITAPAAPATYTANIATRYALTLAANPPGAGTISANPPSADGYYASGTTVMLAATPTAGDAFTGFSGDATGTTNPASVVLSAPRSVTANFGQVAQNIAGSFDTPADNSAVNGAVSVSGWAVSPAGISKIDIWREANPGEPSQNGLVYIGDATRVKGARPDVQKLYPAYPGSDSAGWGLQVLTNELPGDSGGSLGNGTYKLHAVAHATNSQNLDLGVKTIVVDNRHAVVPFGTIDTPTPGATVSGTVINFGWVLTPVSSNVVPKDGSTIWVFVDGQPLGHPMYNQFRADIATLFPGLQNSNGAVGAFTLDTTKLANGVHSIAWSVTDSAGNAQGIGSRFFTVQN